MQAMFALTLALALAEPVRMRERDIWVDCLMSFAQIESAGTKTPASIAIESMTGCGSERALYMKALIRQFQPTASHKNSAIDQAAVQFESDRKVVVRKIIAFVLRSRHD